MNTNRLLAALLLLAMCHFAAAADIVAVTVTSNKSSDQTAVPVTFGQIFKQGDVPAGTGIAARLTDGTILPLQVDRKATHDDGSLRHAILTTKLDIAGTASKVVILSQYSDSAAGSSFSLSDLLNRGFDATVNLDLDGVRYRASAADFLANRSPKRWLSGALVSEWIVGGPLTRADNGNAHPHLAAYFHVRAYSLDRVRVDVVIENNWTFELNPTAFTYNVSINVGSSSYSVNNLTQHHHTRWHRVLWWGTDPALLVTHDGEYLQASKAVPNYQKGLSPSENYLNSMTQSVDPMDNADLRTYFPDVGYGSQIGPLPQWDATYVVSGDRRALRSVLANASAGGAYSVHYRDKSTGYPVSLETYPRLSLNGWRDEVPPESDVRNPLREDGAHQPSIGFLAYLTTGDYFYLEEIQFWANRNMLFNNPNGRQDEKGIFTGENRNQVWSIRSLAQAAYITPDDHPMKQYFIDRVINNITDRTNKWANPSANNLGGIQDFDWARRGQYSPWQNDWFVWVFGYLVELGFDEATTMRDWLSQWPTGRMGQADDEFCFLYAATYNYKQGGIGYSDETGYPNSYYPNFRVLYEKNFPDAASQPCDPNGEMTGHPNKPTSYYSNMQPGLAIAVDAGVADYSVHWARFVGGTKPDYNDNPIWAVVPRSASGTTPRPSIDLSITPSRMSSAGTVSINWRALNANSCTASGGWSGSKVVTPSRAESFEVSETTTFSLTCTGDGGRASSSVTVRVGEAPAQDTTPPSGSDAGSTTDSSTDTGASDSSAGTTDSSEASSTAVDGDGAGGAGALGGGTGLLLLMLLAGRVRRRIRA